MKLCVNFEHSILCCFLRLASVGEKGKHKNIDQINFFIYDDQTTSVKSYGAENEIFKNLHLIKTMFCYTFKIQRQSFEYYEIFIYTNLVNPY